MEASKAESTGFDATEKLNSLQKNIQDFTWRYLSKSLQQCLM